MLRPLLALVVSLPLPFGGPSAAPRDRGRDGWFSADKGKHFAASFVLQSAGYALARTGGLEPGPSLAAASAVTLAIGAGKEWRDRSTGGDPSWRDFTWDVVGAGAATLAIVAAARP